MKKYMLFASLSYYPQGGFDDFIEFFDTIEEAKNCFSKGVKKKLWDWYQIIDTSTWQEIPHD